jgi:hypothetical protein
MVEGSSSDRPLSERVRDIRLIEQALRQAVRDALLRHKQAGNPIAVSRDGGAVWIAPEEIEVGGEN